MSNSTLTPVGQLFFASIINWMRGKKLNMKLKGEPKFIQALSDAIIASKKYQEELNKPNATIESVMNKLNIRNEKIKKFEEITNKNFPL